MNNSYNKKEAVKALLENLSNEQVDEIYNTYVKKANKKIMAEVVENVIEPTKVSIKKDVSKTTPQYKILLELVNGILKNLNKEKITDLTDFKNINRLDIIRKDNTILLDEMSDRIFKHYTKAAVPYHRKSPNITLNCLRGMCKVIGLKFQKTQKAKSIKSKIITQFFYSIVKATE